MIDVSPNHLDIVRTILAKYVPQCEARVFGSRCTGTAKLYSDLDIALVGHEKLDWRLLADIKEEFQESELPFRVDILDWNAITAEFRHVIEDSGYKVLQH
jgi:type I restriction enzyme S subunit